MSRKKFRVWDIPEKKFYYFNKGYQGHYVISLDGNFTNLQNGAGGQEVIDQQYKDQLLRDAIKENQKLKKEVKILEKLIELNMKDLWDIADQRDWYYNEYRRLKDSKDCTK